MFKSKLTIYATVGILAYIIADIIHEVIGHGGTCLLLGNKITLLTSVYFKSTPSNIFVDIGGPETVQNFINSKNFIIKNDEEDMHKDWESQFINNITPNEATKLLSKFNKGKILDKTTTKWLYNAMLNNKSGGNRLKGKLPKNIKIAHRTGTSFTNDKGITGAINDMGIIELPNKKKIILCVLVNDTYESFKKSEEIIADIAKVTYEHYTTK